MTALPLWTKTPPPREEMSATSSIHGLVLQLVVCIVLVGLRITPTHAEDSTTANDREQEARAAFQAGREAYDRGETAKALTHYERAYELSKRPEMLFNIGRAADAEGFSERAMAAYAAYLDALPEAENRAFVESRIAKMRARIEATAPATATQQPDGSQAPAPPPLPAPQLLADSAQRPDGAPAVMASVAPSTADTSSRSRKRAWLWGVAGTVLVGAGVGVAVALARKDGASSQETGEVIMTLGRR